MSVRNRKGNHAAQRIIKACCIYMIESNLPKSDLFDPANKFTQALSDAVVDLCMARYGNKCLQAKSAELCDQLVKAPEDSAEIVRKFWAGEKLEAA